MRKKSFENQFESGQSSPTMMKSLNYETTTTSLPSVSGSYEVDTFGSEVVPLNSENRAMSKNLNPPKSNNGGVIRIPVVDEDKSLLSQDELPKSTEGCGS